MNILSVAWSVYECENSNYSTRRNGGSVMISDICEYIGRIENSYLFVGSISVSNDVKLGNVNLCSNNKYLPNEQRNKENIVEWQKGLIKSFEHILDMIGPDYVLVHGGGEFSYNVLNICREKKISSSFVCHLYVGKKWSLVEGYGPNVWESKILSIPDIKVITVGSAMRNRILEDYSNIDESNVFTIINGTKIDARIVEDEVLLKKDIDYKQKKILICSGSIQPRKNQLQIVEAMELVESEIRERMILIFVGYSSQNNDYKQKIIKKINSAKLNNCIKYIGSIESEKMGQVYTSMDGLILASLIEGVSLVALEALRFGKPVIMFSDNETAEDIKFDEALIEVKSHLTIDLAHAIENWFLGEFNEDRIKDYSKKFKMERVAEDYIHYCEIMK